MAFLSTGAYVRVLASGRTGKLIEVHEDDPDLTYKVDFLDPHVLPHSDWFSALQIEICQVQDPSDGNSPSAGLAACKNNAPSGYPTKIAQDAVAGAETNLPLTAPPARKSTQESYFKLPHRFFNVSESKPGFVRAVPFPRGRTFGDFQEKTLECDKIAKQAIDDLCNQGGFTQAWHRENSDGFTTMEKIPVIILVKIMIGLDEKEDDTAQSLRGAYPICMDPDVRTCMNVVVGRRKTSAGQYALDKFSLYWPDNSVAFEEWGNAWPLLHGYSFRTGVFTGTLNRDALGLLRRGGIPGANSTFFNPREHGLVVDSDSAYEDCAYMDTNVKDGAEVVRARIDKMVTAMENGLKSAGSLAPSYDRDEAKAGITALRGEWSLLQRCAV